MRLAELNHQETITARGLVKLYVVHPRYVGIMLQELEIGGVIGELADEAAFRRRELAEKRLIHGPLPMGYRGHVEDRVRHPPSHIAGVLSKGGFLLAEGRVNPTLDNDLRRGRHLKIHRFTLD